MQINSNQCKSYPFWCQWHRPRIFACWGHTIWKHFSPALKLATGNWDCFGKWENRSTLRNNAEVNKAWSWKSWLQLHGLLQPGHPRSGDCCSERHGGVSMCVVARGPELLFAESHSYSILQLFQMLRRKGTLGQCRMKLEERDSRSNAHRLWETTRTWISILRLNASKQMQMVNNCEL